MEAAKSEENDDIRKGEKTSNRNTDSRRGKKSKVHEYCDGSQKKTMRAKTRIALTDDTIPQSSVNKVPLVDLTEDEDCIIQSKETVDSPPPKKDIEIIGPPKKDLTVTVEPKKVVTGSGSVQNVGIIVTSILKKKDVSGSGQSKNGERIGLVKKDVHFLLSPIKDIEPSVVKNRKFKVQNSGNVISEKKHDDWFNLSEVTTSEKSKHKDDKLKADQRESRLTSNKTDHEMISDVTSDEKPSRPVCNIGYAPVVASGNLTKEGGWFPGDLAWGRVGHHPFWPCLVATDPACGIYTKTKRVGRGQNSVQQSLHVQFFGDSGRHSWIPSTSVIKYEGPDQFHKFADNVLNEMKKKDKRYLSAFYVKPSSKVRWEVAIREAELSVPKARGDRIEFFRELLPKQKTAVEKAELVHKNVTNETKFSFQLVKKRNNRPNVSVEKSAKQIKIEQQVAMEDDDASKKTENTMINAPTREKCLHANKLVNT